MTALTTRDLDGIHNFRALAPYPLKGGGTIRPGMVYRSGALELMTDADCAYLSGEARISLVLDLRHPDEWGAVPIEHALRDRVAPLSLFPESTTVEGLIAELNGLYGTGPSPERYLHYLEVGGARFAQAFDTLSRAESYPVLVHCTAGKDRTGVASALLLAALGVDDDTIAADYGLSRLGMTRLVEFVRLTYPDRYDTMADQPSAFLDAPDAAMRLFLADLREQHGSVERYAESVGVGPDVVEALRDNLLV